jgi:hypothetical protein
MNPRLAACLVLFFAGCLHLEVPVTLASAPGTPPPLTAEADEPASILLGSPLGITSRDDSSVRVKTAGFAPGWPSNLPGDLPQPAFETFTRQLLQGITASHAPIAAMSLGIDVIVVGDEEVDPEEVSLPLGSYPVLQLGAHGWYAIEFSVDSDQLGPSPDLALDIIRAGDELDGSVFCYVLPTSTATLLPLEQDSVRTLLPEHLGLANNDAIHGLNMHMGLYGTDLARYPEVFTTRPLPPQPSVYFTLWPAFVDEATPAVLAAAWGIADPALVDAKTIFRSQWTGSAWTKPVIYHSLKWFEVAVPPGLAIDGLALDTKRESDDLDDELLYSLTSAPNNDVPPERQVMHVAAKTKNPRPVLVKRPNGSSRSLGRAMHAGRGIGDMCTADPWALAARNVSVFTAEELLDDFLVARRLPPDGPYVQPSMVIWPPFAHHPSLHPGLPTGLDLSLIRRLPEPGRWVPGRPVVPPVLALPELRLAIAAYRSLRGSDCVVRACLSWPRPLATAGEATVRWGIIEDYAKDVTEPGNLRWTGPDSGSLDLAYVGKPLQVDLRIPTDGMLPPGRRATSPSILPDATNPPKGPRQAIAVQWSLVADGGSYLSPIAALRY